MIAREGYVIIAGAVVLAIGLVFLGWRLELFWRALLWTLAAVVVGFTLFFFRDPERTPPLHATHLVLAPADGRVVVVDEVEEPLYLNGPARQVSIFLSPLDVHVNRVPADGVIEFDEYVAGDYLVAWHPKASDKNERSQLGLLHPSGTKILFKQIAGAVARRIEYHITVGDTVRAGERFGIVKFGSRMDVLVPRSVELDVKVGDRVRAGTTVLGKIPERPPAAADSSVTEQTAPS